MPFEIVASITGELNPSGVMTLSNVGSDEETNLKLCFIIMLFTDIFDLLFGFQISLSSGTFETHEANAAATPNLLLVSIRLGE